MSVQGDTELSDLVAQTLENAGVLAKIRAELRASVFLVLEEHEAFKGRNVTFNNNPLKEFLSTKEGIVVVNLIREFLDYFSLEFTASVFEPETQVGKDYEYCGRDKLAQDLKLNSEKKTPLIAQVLQESKVCFPTEILPKDDISDNKKDKTKENKNCQENNNPVPKLEVPNPPLSSMVKNHESSAKEAVNGDGKHPLLANSSSPPSFQNHVKKPDKLDLNQINLKPAASSLSSLGGLPPLGLSQNNPSSRTSSKNTSKQVSNDIKALLDLGSESPENNYEEDFHASGSEKTSKGTNRSLSGSGSEIEEEMSVGMEDHTTDLSSGGSGKSSGGDL